MKVRVKLIKWKCNSHTHLGSKSIYTIGMELLNLDNLETFKVSIESNKIGPYRNFDDISLLLNRASYEGWIGEYIDESDNGVPGLRFIRFTMVI
jgi:hypothetical protein